MAQLKPEQIRKMSKAERNEQLKSLHETLLKQRASVAMGGAPSNPGLIKSVKRQIARILTINRMEEIK
ncbi:MAG: 50S ribosomal protein L29 [Thermoplasmataceae archaeon]